MAFIKRCFGLLSFVVSAVWVYRWEAVRGILYEHGWAMLTGHVETLLQYGVPGALLGIGIGLFIWSRPPKSAGGAAAAGPQEAAAAVQISTPDDHRPPVENIAPAAPATNPESPYSRAEIDEMLTAMRRISILINQTAVIARDAVQELMNQWAHILDKRGKAEFMAEMDMAQLKVQRVVDETWEIVKDYRHYHDEIGPILNAANFSGRFFQAIGDFRNAASLLPGESGYGATLNLLMPQRDEFAGAAKDLQNWMTVSFERLEHATKRLRAERSSAASENEPTSVPSRDIGLSEAVAYVCFREWGKRFIDAAGTSSVDAANGYDVFLQAAADGEIPIWGKKESWGVHQPIPKDFWFQNRIDWMDLLRGEGCSESSQHAFSGDKYASMMTSKTAVEQKWPAQA
jgi:hypothetical protein